MNQFAVRNQSYVDAAHQDKRHHEIATPNFFLRELDHATILDSLPLDEECMVEDIHSSGQMRETCPECQDTHLQLVLRQKNVRVAHLFCAKCMRCFDACYPDGCSALVIC